MGGLDDEWRRGLTWTRRSAKAIKTARKVASVSHSRLVEKGGSGVESGREGELWWDGNFPSRPERDLSPRTPDRPDFGSGAFLFRAFDMLKGIDSGLGKERKRGRCWG